MSEGASESSKDATPRTAESFATWLSLFGVSPAGTPVPEKPAPPSKRARKERASGSKEDSDPST